MPAMCRVFCLCRKMAIFGQTAKFMADCPEKRTEEVGHRRGHAIEKDGTMVKGVQSSTSLKTTIADDPILYGDK